MRPGLDGEGKAPAPTAKTSDFWVRTFSTIVLMPPALIVAYLGGIFYAAGIALLGYLILMEWCAITAGPAREVFQYGIGLIMILAFLAAGTGYWTIGLALMGAAVALAVAVQISGRATRWLAAGVAYFGAACLSLLLLRQGDDGVFVVLFLLAIVWATDICAYLIGRSIGGPKLWPAISPKKTWSGSVGGLICGVAAGVGLLAALDISIGVRVILIAALLSLSSQVGDLMESAFKRLFSVKDSGKLIPGHGGVLDRLDGLLIAAIVAILVGGLQAGFSNASHGLLTGF